MRITKSVVFDVNKCGGRFYVGWDNFDLLTWLCSGHYNGWPSPRDRLVIPGYSCLFLSFVQGPQNSGQWKPHHSSLRPIMISPISFLSPLNFFFQNLCIIWILIKHVHGVEIKCNEGGDDSYSGTLRPDPPKHLKHSSSTTFTWIPVLCSSRPYFFLSGPS